MKSVVFINFLLLVLSFSALLPKGACSQAEKQLTGRITDENSHPLPYVNIGIIGTSIGTVSGPDGSFTLFLAENVSGEDTLRFSMVGHQSCSFAIKDFFIKMKEEIAVVLPAISADLPEVVVRPRFSNKKQIGTGRSNTRMFTNFAISKKSNQNLGAEIGRKFNLPKGEVQLDTFQFYISHNNFDTVRLRVNVYKIENGKPGHNLAPVNIIVELTKSRTGWVTVDLTPYQFKLSGKVAMAVEWIYHSAKGKALALPIAMPAAGIHFYKYGSQGKWKKFVGMSAAMRLDVSY